MRRIALLSAVLLAASAATPGLAQTAPDAVVIKSDAVLKTSDGRSLGRIGKVVKKDGAPVAASIIFDGHIIQVPAETITESGGGLVTSLAYADVRKIKPR